MNKPVAPAELSPRISVCGGENRPYHHGDLRRALILAAERILEREGPQALSLRAVAREAGVSPAAPYHHFKDKSDLLLAIAGAGFEALGEAIQAAVDADTEQKATTIGCAYVKFARSNPALYRVMYDSSRDAHAMPGREVADENDKEHAGLKLVEQAMIRAGVDPNDEIGLKLACITAWCAAHGVAEMVGFAQFKPMIEAVGGEDQFIEALIARSCSVADPRV
jgi:AcrR family transcriptional regulator